MKHCASNRHASTLGMADCHGLWLAAAAGKVWLQRQRRCHQQALLKSLYCKDTTGQGSRAAGRPPPTPLVCWHLAT